MTPRIFADIAPPPLPPPANAHPSAFNAGAHPAAPATAAAAASSPNVHASETASAAALATGAPAPTLAGAPTPSAVTPSAADDRSTTFQGVDTGTETHSGSTLMVEAYAVLWVILMGWIVMLWRKQSVLHSRLDDLERAIDGADARAANVEGVRDAKDASA
jgi:hypothetical protein